MKGARKPVYSRAYLIWPAAQFWPIFDRPHGPFLSRNSGVFLSALHSELWMWLELPARL